MVPERSRRGLLRLGAAGLSAAVAGCTSFTGGGSESGSDGPDGTNGTDTSADGGTPTGTPTAEDWRTIELTDVLTDETFTFEDLAGQPILLETFAVWCPTCEKQARQIAKLHGEMDEVVSVSLNTDPSEDATKVREYAEDKGFDWRFVISPPRMTDSLEARFGLKITYPPNAPVVRICPDGSAELLGTNSVKSADELRSAIESC